MAKKKKQQQKKDGKKSNYEDGYKKPPKEHQWKKGCKSPKPKGRPKQIKSIKVALQINLGKEIPTTNEKGEPCKISCAEALVQKTLKDAILKDGATRRLLFRQDLLNIETKEREIEYPQEVKNKKEVEDEFKGFIEELSKLPAEKREKYRRILSEALREYLNDEFREE